MLRERAHGPWLAVTFHLISGADRIGSWAKNSTLLTKPSPALTADLMVKVRNVIVEYPRTIKVYRPLGSLTFPHYSSFVLALEVSCGLFS